MSAASPAMSTARRTEAAAPARPVRQQAQAFAFSAPRGEDEIRLNLADIPRMEATMDIEGFKPSLLSRLFDLVAPLDKR